MNIIYCILISLCYMYTPYRHLILNNEHSSYISTSFIATDVLDVCSKDYRALSRA